ncbi:MAG: peptidoglycan DD-metalloendopeptidase family protein [Clostridium baratii]|uniref:peptidoglycan DD-metalloendopeptidase family protein n=1 Tax=Clostridium baratii TaxID=1561 RepID=UPI0024311119|nr:peptidoglycan DD-metalloendopeptidase family protein [Clostridium baratii]MBS6042866.1 peptidoglycan DD-metalloendopeptidase family protein [Clostridium baratii]
MSSSKKKKIILTITSFLMISTWLYAYLESSTKSFAAYLGDVFIGYSLNKESMEENYKNVIDNLNSNLNENEKIETSRLSFKRLNEEANQSTYNEIKQNVVNSMEKDVTLKALKIDGKNIGYVTSKEEFNNAIKRVASMYSSNLNIDENKITSINVKGNISFKDEKVNISKLSSEEELADNIIKNKSLIDVDIVVNDTRLVDIEPSVKIERSEELLIGESKVTEGKKGKKEQNINITYRNGEKKSVSVLSENIIEQSSSKVITKGTKSILNGTSAVFTSPTRGGTITSNFGERWGKNHNGLDIAGNIGDPVMAALDGKVKSTFYERNGYGNVVILEHEGGVETRYAHMSKIGVKTGDTVKKGDIVGEVGSTGRSTGPHLHFEVRVNGSPVDPQKYIG